MAIKLARPSRWKSRTQLVAKPTSKARISLIAMSLCTQVVPVAAQQAQVSPTLCLDNELPEQRVRAMISTEAEQQGVDAKLALAIAKHESGFGSKTNSPAGARGVMQLMPATAERYNVKEVCDPAQNIRGGITYLKDLDKLFGGHVMLIVAAYNSGENRVISAGGIPAIAETVNYTALVTNTYFGFSNILGADRTALRAAPKRQSAPGPDILSVAATPDKPIPINTNRTVTSENTWLGGSVLYIQ